LSIFEDVAGESQGIFEQVAQESKQSDIFEQVAAESSKKESKPEKSTLLPTIARIAPALIGAGVGSAVPVVGTAAGGAIGAGLGEGLAQYLEGEFKPAQIPLSVLLGLIPAAKVPGVTSTLGRIGLRAGEGALMGAGGHAASEVLEGRMPTLRGTAMTGGIGALLGGGFGGLEARGMRRAADAAVPPQMPEPEVPLSSVAPEMGQFQPHPIQTQFPEEDLIAALMAKETPEQVLARRGVVGWEPTPIPGPEDLNLKGVYERMHGRNRFDEELAAQAMAAGEPYPKGKYGTYDLAPDLMRDQTMQNVDARAIEMQRIYNPEGLAERLIERSTPVPGWRGADPLYPGNAPKPLKAKDIENFIQTGSTDPIKVQRFMLEQRAKAEGISIPTRTTEVGANILGVHVPERGFFRSLAKDFNPSSGTMDAPNPMALLWKGIGVESSKMLQGFGQSGAKLVDLVRRTYDGFETQLSNYIDGPQGVLHLANRMKLSKAERENITDFMEGIAPAMNERVAHIAKIMKAQRLAIDARASGLLEIRDIVTDAKIPWQPRQNYMPHFTDWDAVVKDPARRVKAISEIQAQESMTRGSPISLAEAEDILMRMQRNSRMEYGHLEIARRFSLSDYERDGIKAWARYAEGALKRINEAENFGRRHEIAGQLVNQIGQETRSDMTQWMARNYMERVTGREFSDNPILKAFVGGARSLQVGLKLGQAVIANASQSTLTGLVTGYGNLLKGFRDTMTTAGQDFARLGGATLEETARQINENLGAGTFGSKVLKYTGFTKVEQFNRMLAANAGRQFARDLGQKIMTATGRRAEMYKRHLRTMGIEPMDLIQRGGVLTPDEEIKAARSIISRTQFKVRPQELPLFWSGPMGKLVTQFSSFGFKAAKAINDEVVQEARKGNYMPLARFALAFPLVGEIVADAQSVAKGGRERPENMVARLAENYAAIGSFGLFYDAWRSAQYGEVGILRRMVGPTLGDIGQLGGGLGEMGKYIAAGGETPGGEEMAMPKMLGRLASQNVPVIGPYLRPTMFPPKNRRDEDDE
jgi:hypothetical protein